MSGRFRIRRFRTRLLLLIVGLLAGAQLAAYVLVSRANRANAISGIGEALDRGARQFQSIIHRREEDLLLAARVMAGDYAMRQLFLMDEFSPDTASSALATYRNRIDAPVIVMLDPAGDLLADTDNLRNPDALRPFVALYHEVEQEALLEGTGYGFVGNKLHQLVLVPILAPPPEIVAWAGLGFPIDEAVALELKANSNLDVSFVTIGTNRRMLASTLAPDLARQLAMSNHDPSTMERDLVRLQDEDYVTTYRALPTTTMDAEPVWIVLQRSLNAELEPARALERVILLISLAGLAAATVAALGLARSISKPVQQLAAHTAVIAHGDYATRLELERADELGELARSFNAMSAGLAERDQVRDLLDKNVSPEVAAQLMREGGSLGGEERVVTMLFADLRGFTSLSEKVEPRELVALLNRYLERMSRAIEAEGGVIDKFIGDEIMALFGAPLAVDDGADRAIRAALAMRQALAELNREFAAEGRPQLGFGVGINTARVIAGNIGSERRRNYSVVGDGVNLAARLQGLTRNAAFAADILVSAETLAATRGHYTTRDLGLVGVKGKSEVTHIHAVDGNASA
ncbi:MAG TPA: adenylate/guanylate cyclase domain-containing protein [Opitutaceae bacterium]